MATDTVLKAGRTLDALVAERVMGIEHRCARQPNGMRFDIVCPVCDTAEHYSTDITAAWAVVETLHGRMTIMGPGAVEIFDKGERVSQWTCAFMDEDGYPDYFAEADTAPLAICLAALKTVEDDAD